MPISTVLSICVAVIILLASNDDIAELKAQQIAAKNALIKIRIKKQFYKEQKNGNNNN